MKWVPVLLIVYWSGKVTSFSICVNIHHHMLCSNYRQWRWWLVHVLSALSKHTTHTISWDGNGYASSCKHICMAHLKWISSSLCPHYLCKRKKALTNNFMCIMMPCIITHMSRAVPVALHKKRNMQQVERIRKDPQFTPPRTLTPLRSLLSKNQHMCKSRQAHGVYVVDEKRAWHETCTRCTQFILVLVVVPCAPVHYSLILWWLYSSLFAIGTWLTWQTNSQQQKEGLCTKIHVGDHHRHEESNILFTHHASMHKTFFMWW